MVPTGLALDPLGLLRVPRMMTKAMIHALALEASAVELGVPTQGTASTVNNLVTCPRIARNHDVREASEGVAVEAHLVKAALWAAVVVAEVECHHLNSTTEANSKARPAGAPSSRAHLDLRLRCGAVQLTLP